MEACAEQQVPVPVHSPFNLVSVGVIRWGRSLCVLLFLLCTEMCDLDHIISTAFWIFLSACEQGCGVALYRCENYMWVWCA